MRGRGDVHQLDHKGSPENVVVRVVVALPADVAATERSSRGAVTCVGDSLITVDEWVDASASDRAVPGAASAA